MKSVPIAPEDVVGKNFMSHCMTLQMLRYIHLIVLGGKLNSHSPRLHGSSATQVNIQFYENNVHYLLMIVITTK